MSQETGIFGDLRSPVRNVFFYPGLCLCSSLHFEGLSMKYWAIPAYLWPLTTSFQISDKYLVTSGELQKESRKGLTRNIICLQEQVIWRSVRVELVYYIYN